MTTDVAVADEENCRQAIGFVKLFYDAMDRKREKTAHMYCEEEPMVVWNGNPIVGQDNISKFLSELPSTRHEMVSVDAQRIPSTVSGAPDCLVVLIAGSVTVAETVHAFTETITLVLDDGTRKVKSQRLRYVD